MEDPVLLTPRSARGEPRNGAGGERLDGAASEPVGTTDSPRVTCTSSDG